MKNNMKLYPKIDFESFKGNMSHDKYIKEYIDLFYLFFYDYFTRNSVYIKIPSFEFNIESIICNKIVSQINSKYIAIDIKWIIAHGDPLKKAIFCKENNINPEDVYILFEDMQWLEFLINKNPKIINKLKNVMIGTKTISRLTGMTYEEISEFSYPSEYIVGGFSEHRILDRKFKNIATKHLILKDIEDNFDRNVILDNYKRFEELVIKKFK